MQVAIMPNLEKPEAIHCARQAGEILSSAGWEILWKQSLLDGTGKLRPGAKASLAECQCIVAVGGDGTIIHTAKLAAALDKPILGINAGTLGFTAGMEPEEMEHLPELLSGLQPEEHRLMLSVSLLSQGKKTISRALNDAVVSGEQARLIDYQMSLGNGASYRCRADGFLVATPTGSTAYSLSAGGPVIEPDMQCLIYTPICPHTFFNRSLVFGGNTRLTVTIPQNAGHLFLTVDGEEPIPLQTGDTLRFSRSRRFARFLRMEGHSFFDVLNRKLIHTRNT